MEGTGGEVGLEKWGQEHRPVWGGQTGVTDKGYTLSVSNKLV